MSTKAPASTTTPPVRTTLRASTKVDGTPLQLGNYVDAAAVGSVQDCFNPLHDYAGLRFRNGELADSDSTGLLCYGRERCDHGATTSW